MTNTFISGARLYWENKGYSFFGVRGVVVPTAVSVFPDELYPAPRSWTERAFPKLIHYNKVEKADTLLPGNSRNSSQKRFAQGSDHSAMQPTEGFGEHSLVHTQKLAGAIWRAPPRLHTPNQENIGGDAHMPDTSQFNIDRTYPGRWTITFSNPPINMFVPTTIVELGALMTDLEADPSVKVVVFQSANPDFFIAHLDVSKAAERPEVLGLWRDFVLRLSSTPVVSIAKICGRTRGIGNEFMLACDMRFASRQNALFGQPEVGVGLIPGGGALEWLPRLVGRSRALEIVLSADDFDADVAERYGWVNRRWTIKTSTRSSIRLPGAWPRSTVKRWPRPRPRSIGSGCRQPPSFSRATT